MEAGCVFFFWKRAAGVFESIGKLVGSCGEFEPRWGARFDRNGDDDKFEGAAGAKLC